MNMKKIRFFILNHYITRELFFYFGKRKANIKKIDKYIKNGKFKISNKKAENIIISLTSYGTRISELKYTLYSLISQTILPEKIIVNIAFEDKKYLNNELKLFERYGVEYNFYDDIRSYKKLIPTLKKYSDKCIITTDDDIYYKKDWLSRLYNTHNKYPNDVCCHFVYKITYENGQINQYKKWKYNYKSYSAENGLFLLGATGVLYPPNVFYKDILNEYLFTKLAPLADDIWFYFMVILNGKKIRQISNPLTHLCYVNPYREYGISGGTTLTQQNVGENKNDTQFRNVLKYYNISENKFIEYLEGKNENCLLDC